MTKSQRAIYAAKNRRAWGRFSAARYAAKHRITRLYAIACQLEAAKRGGV